MDSIQTSTDIKQLFHKEKNSLNFTYRSNDDFLKFLLNTVSKLVENFKPVIDEACYEKSPGTSINSYSPKKRLNQERFKTEQVNKSVDVGSQPLDVGSQPLGVGSQPLDDSTPVVSKENVRPSPKAVPSNTYNIFRSPLKLRNLSNSPASSPTKKFFSDIKSDDIDEPFIPQKIKHASNDSSPNTPSVSPLFKSEISKSSHKSSKIPKFNLQKVSSFESKVSIQDSNHEHDVGKTSADTDKVPVNTNTCVSINNDAVLFKSGQNHHTSGKTCKSDSANQISALHEVSPEHDNAASSESGAVNTDKSRRITDCQDKLCKYCPSYDPEYAACFPEEHDDVELQSLDEEEYSSSTEQEYDLLVFKSASEDIQPRKTSPDLKGAQAQPPRDLSVLQITDYGGEQEDVENQTIYSWRDWSMVATGDTTRDETDSTVVSADNSTVVVPAYISKLADKELRTQLIGRGALVGPITTSTRRIYEQYLVKLESSPVPLLDDSLEGYPRELISCLQGQPQTDWSAAELQMVGEFQTPVVGRRYREGTKKCCFNYLLLDPRIADDLPKKAEVLNPIEIFKLFIKSVFYIGKGKQSRPYAHLFEASLKNKDSDKLRKIRDIWAGGRGVISLHVYNNTIAEEAFTREAVMLTCMGMKKVCNEKSGEYYGVSRTWTVAKKRGVGLALLYKAHLTLLNEGLRELREQDIVSKS